MKQINQPINGSPLIKPLELESPRPLWGPGITQAVRAKRYVNSLVLSVFQDIDGKTMLQVGCGSGDTLVYLQESRDARYSGITGHPEWVAPASHKVLKANMQHAIRFFAAQPTDDRSYRPFPNQDMVLLLDSIGPYGLSHLASAAAALRPGGRFFLGGLFSETLRNPAPGFLIAYPQLHEVLETAEKAGMVLLDQEDVSSMVKVDFTQKMLGSLKARKNSQDYQVQLNREAEMVKQKILGYHIVQWVKKA